MNARGLFADDQLGRNLPVRHPFPKQRQDLELPGGQLERRHVAKRAAVPVRVRLHPETETNPPGQ